MLASNNLSESEIPMASICFCPGTKAKLNSTRTATTLAIGVSRIIFSYQAFHCRGQDNIYTLLQRVL